MLRLAVIRVPDHPDVPDKTPVILFDLDLKAALKDHVSQRRLSRRARRFLDDAFTAAEDELKNLTTTL